MAGRKCSKRKTPLYEFCEWIANPGYDSCPRIRRTDQSCECNHLPPDWWMWRVIPPLWDPHSDRQPYFYDEDGAHPVSRDFQFNPSSSPKG